MMVSWNKWIKFHAWNDLDYARTHVSFLEFKLTISYMLRYKEVDNRIKVDFPHKFGNTDTKHTTKPVQSVASAQRSVKPGRKTVRLTSSQVAIAKKLGVPLEEYAKQLNTKEA